MHQTILSVLHLYLLDLLSCFSYINRPLRKLAAAKEMAGDLGAQNRNVLAVHEDLSTKSTPQFLAEVKFPKKSNHYPALKLYPGS